MKQISILFFFLFFGTGTGAPASDWFSPEEDKKAETTVASEEIDTKIRRALANPYRYFRRGEHKELLRLLEVKPSVSFSSARMDSLEAVLESARRRRNAILIFVMDLVMYAHAVENDGEKACLALQEAGGVAGNLINDPHLALSVFRLARTSDCAGAAAAVDSMHFYIENDLVINKLLTVPTASKSDSELTTFIQELATAVHDYPASSLRASAMKKTGDMHFRLKNYRDMRRWYLQVLEMRPEMEKASPIGYRLMIAGKFFLRKKITFAVFAAYGILLLFLILRITRSGGRFQFGFFAKRAGGFLLLYAVCAAAVFFLDSFFFPKTAMKLPEVSYLAVEPIVPLSILDGSGAPLPFVVLSLGFLPVLYVLVYLSFKGPCSRLLLMVLAALLVASVWPHFFLRSTFDEYLWTQSIFQKERVFMEGEMEILLLDDPDKVRKANPEFLKGDNVELKQFIQANFKEGLDKFK
jgi:hypothetical protein